jgi:Zn-dependent protease with chaperone function
MQPIAGSWFTAGQARREPAELTVDASGVARVVAQGEGRELARVAVAELDVSSRLGQTPRFVRMPCGGVLETSDNDAVDAMLRQWQPRRFQGWIHKLESHLPFVLVTAVLVLVIAWAAVVHGLPAAAERMAHALPAETLNTISRETLGLMDKLYLKPTELSAEKQAELQADFAPVLANYPELPLKVLFRKGGDRIGANAFALPDGTMIFTDEIVKLAERNEELVAILAHEVGHIHHRHSLRAMIQNSVIGIAYVMVVGDASAVGDLFVGLPVVAATLAYSRDHELEADRFAVGYLDRHGIDRHAFVDILQRMESSAHCRELLSEDDDVTADGLSETERAALCEEVMAERDEFKDKTWTDYFSTHPAMQERLAQFVEYPVVDR